MSFASDGQDGFVLSDRLRAGLQRISIVVDVIVHPRVQRDYKLNSSPLFPGCMYMSPKKPAFAFGVQPLGYQEGQHVNIKCRNWDLLWDEAKDFDILAFLFYHGKGRIERMVWCLIAN